MALKNRTYSILDEHELNLQFYERFDHAFIINKVSTLWTIVNNAEEFTTWAKTLGSSGEGITPKYFESLRAEIFFSEFHQFEALFALLCAVFQPLPHWLYLATYTNNEIREKVSAFVEGDIKSITKGQFETVKDFIISSIYQGYGSGECDVWDLSVDNVAWLLERMARKYLTASDTRNGEYNAYKHGLRVVTGEHALYIGIGPKPSTMAPLAASKDSVSFLAVEPAGGTFSVKETTKHFNPAESMAHMSYMMSFLEVVKSTRLAVLKGETDPSNIGIRLFHLLDKDEILSLHKHFQISQQV